MMLVMILHLILLSLHISLSILDLFIELGFDLFLCHALSLALMLIFLQLVANLILEKLDIIIKFCSFNSIPVMA